MMMKLLHVLGSSLILIALCLFVRATPVTVASIDVPNWRAGGVTCSLRLYASDAFTDSAGVRYIGGSVGSLNFFQKVDGTVTGTICTLPSFTLQSTTDAMVNPAVRLTAALYDSKDVNRGVYLSSFAVPASLGGSVTWAQITSFNQAVTRPASPEYYNKDQVNSQIQQQIGNIVLNDASSSIKGKTALSAPPTNPANPVAVGTNAPSYQAAIVQKYMNDPAFGGSLQSAITAIGATETQLVMSGDTNVASAITVPANIQLIRNGSAKFVKSGSGTLTFAGPAIAKEVGRVQMFSGFAAGEVRFTGIYPDEIYPEWFGAKGDNVSDDLPAFNAMLAALRTTGANPDFDRVRGARIKLAPTIYYLSNTWKIVRTVHLEGAGGDRYRPASSLRFPKNVRGLTTEGYSTLDGSDPGLNPDRLAITAGFSTFENFGIYGAVSDNNAVVDTSGLTVTLKNSGAIKQISIIGNNSGLQALAPGSTITMADGNSYVIANTLSPVTGTTIIPVNKPRYYVFANGTSTVQMIGDVNGAGWAGLTIRINGVNYTVVSFAAPGGPTLLTLNTTVPNYAGWGVLQSLPVTTNQPARINIYHGFDPKVQVQMRGVSVTNFSGNGFNLNSGQYPSFYPGGEPNLNLSTFQNIQAFNNRGTGIIIYGVNSQPMQFDSPNVESNEGAGIYEEGSSGVIITSAHSAYNKYSSFVMTGQSSGNLLVNCYTEGGQPGILLGQYSMALGGIFGNGAGIDAENGFANFIQPSPYGGISSEAGYAMRRGVQSYAGTLNDKAVGASIGFRTYPNTLFAFGAGEEAINTDQGNPASLAALLSWQFAYNGFEPGLYSWHYGGNYALQMQTVMGFTGDHHALGGGHLVFPQGFYLGQSGTTRRRWQYVNAVPASGTATLGDIYWNNSAGAGLTQPTGWIVSTAGTIGSTAVLTPFGNRADLDAKAPLASPVFTGTPTVPTAATGTSTTQAASTAFVQNQFAANILSGTASLDFPSVAASSTAELTITVTGATVGDVSICSPSMSLENGLIFSSYVSSANTVTVRVGNITSGAIDPAPRNWTMKVFK